MEIAPEAPFVFHGMPFNMVTLYMSWLVMGVLVFGAWMATRRMTEVPGRWQLCMEQFVVFFDSVSEQALRERGRQYLPFVGSIFLFIWGCNLIGIIPLPYFEEPTRDLNTPIGLAILAIATAHVSAIVAKGFRSWWWEFFEPSFPASGTVGVVAGVVSGVIAAGVFVLIAMPVCKAMPGLGPAGQGIAVAALVLLAAAIVMTAVFAFQMRRVPNLPMAPLNFVGEVGKSISLPFRLYGNIFGGAVIMIVLSALLKQVVMPIGLMFFFGLFVGTIQAFVFSMLALTYVAVAITEEEVGGREGQ